MLFIYLLFLLIINILLFFIYYALNYFFIYFVFAEVFDFLNSYLF